MVLRLGKIRGAGEERILTPGLRWTWPAPILGNRQIRSPGSDPGHDAFWFFMTTEEKLRAQSLRGNTLDTKQDGYCLTRAMARPELTRRLQHRDAGGN